MSREMNYTFTRAASQPHEMNGERLDDTFIRKPPALQRRHKWLLFVVLTGVVILVILICLGVFWKKHERFDSVSRMLANLDPSVDPCEDFYQFACGGFLSNVTIPDDEVEVSMLTSIEDRVERQLREVLEEPIMSGELRSFQLAKDFYKTCLDKDAIDSRGVAPLKKILKQVGGWPVLEDSWHEDSFVWWKTVIQLQSMGYVVDYFMSVAVEPDAKNSTYRTIVVDQPDPDTALEFFRGIIPKRTYHPDVSIVASYHAYLVELATVLGANELTAKREMAKVILFYIEMIEIALPDENRRNMNEMYNPMTVDDLQRQFPIVPWVEYLNGMLPDNVRVASNDRVIVAVPGFFYDLITLLNNTNPRVLANYLISQAVISSVKYLSSDLRSKEEQFYSKLMGTSRTTEPWRECVILVSESLWSSVGAMYVRKYFKEETKKAAVQMVNNIRDQFVDILKKVDWMDDTTRKRCLEKAVAMVMHVAYADELLDDTKLDHLYKDLSLDTSMFLESTLNVSKFWFNLLYGKLREKVNKTEWISHSMSAIVNAFYSVNDNSIQIPAGILQGHLFNAERPWFMNYGASGFVIGHEITHGFDDQGSQFDADSNLVDWWEPATKLKYLNKTQCIVEQYGNYIEMASGRKLNGINTQGENIADNGGIKTAYQAYLSWVERNGEESGVPGVDYNPRQMFWILGAQTWCNKYRPHAARMIVDSEHSPGKFRVLGSFSNLEDFSKDFSCPLGSSMNPPHKCSIW